MKQIADAVSAAAACSRQDNDSFYSVLLIEVIFGDGLVIIITYTLTANDVVGMMHARVFQARAGHELDSSMDRVGLDWVRSLL